MEIDAKLEEYLTIHSMNLTSDVRDYLKRRKEGKMTPHDEISALGLIAFERKKFLKSLRAIETKF